MATRTDYNDSGWSVVDQVVDQEASEKIVRYMIRAKLHLETVYSFTVGCGHYALQ